MIWATNKEGRITYVSEKWTEITGQSYERALGDGWKDVIHPGDIEAIFTIFTAALRAKSPFALQYRLRIAGGSYVWVTGGAVPSFGPPDEDFLGYLGSITKIANGRAEIAAGGRLGSFYMPPENEQTAAYGLLDQVADHLLMAHSLVLADGGRSILPPLREAMMCAAIELTKVGARSSDPGRQSHH